MPSTALRSSFCLSAIISKVPSLLDPSSARSSSLQEGTVSRFCCVTTLQPAGDACFAEHILQPATSKQSFPTTGVESQLMFLLGVMLKEGRREAEVEGREESFQVEDQLHLVVSF